MWQSCILASALVVLVSPGGDDVSFKVQPLKRGQKVSITSTTQGTTTVHARIGGKEVHKMDMPSVASVTCVVTATEVDDKGVQSAKLEFRESKLMVPSPFGLLRNGMGHGARSVDAKRTDHGFAATSEVEEDSRILTDRICESVLMLPLSSTLAGKTMKKGDVVKVSTDAARGALALFASVLEVRSLTLTLDGERNESGIDVAAFKVVATLAKAATNEDQSDVAIDVTGDLTIAKSGLFVVAATLTGTTKLSGSVQNGTQKMDMEGTGDVTWKYSAKVEWRLDSARRWRAGSVAASV